MKLLYSKTNVKSHATAGERKAMPLAHRHEGKMKASGSEPSNFKFPNTSVGKTMQDYGNFYTQAIRM